MIELQHQHVLLIFATIHRLLILVRHRIQLLLVVSNLPNVSVIAVEHIWVLKQGLRSLVLSSRLI